MLGRIGYFGGLVAIYGLVSIGLHFINYNLRILMWIDNWGSTVGWVIRIGLVVGGAIVFLIGRMASDD